MERQIPLLNRKTAKGKFKENDLGFGSKVTESHKRLINKNGSFNTEKKGLPLWQQYSIYTWLISIPWKYFFLVIFSAYFVTNLLFTCLYWLAGMDGLEGIEAASPAGKFWEGFFFSTQTLSTLGYGRISPVGTVVSIIAGIESMMGVLAFALATGLLYGRFSKPVSKILFSENALVAPYRDSRALMFRIANKSHHQLIELEVEVIFSILKQEESMPEPVRRFFQLPLERKKVNFFPTTWTLVHPINSDSPLQGMLAADLENGEVEVMVLVRGFDETFGQNVHSRYSYTWDEILWNRSFVTVFHTLEKGGTRVDLNRINESKAVEAQEPEIMQQQAPAAAL